MSRLSALARDRCPTNTPMPKAMKAEIIQPKRNAKSAMSGMHRAKGEFCLFLKYQRLERKRDLTAFHRA
jgi:hypothetical protein